MLLRPNNVLGDHFALGGCEEAAAVDDVTQEDASCVVVFRRPALTVEIGCDLVSFR